MKHFFLKTLALIWGICLALPSPAVLAEAYEAESPASTLVDEMVDETTVMLEGGEAESNGDEPATTDSMPVDEENAAADRNASVPVFRMVADCKKTMKVGEQFQFDHGSLKLLSYSSSDNWRTVDCDNGLVYARSAGSVKITARFAGGKRAVLSLTVVDPSAPSRVQIKKPRSTRLDIRHTLQLSATLYPASSQSDLVWKSSAEGIAEVDKSGRVIPHNVGRVVITATTLKGNRTDRITLNIVDLSMPTSIRLNKSGTVNLDMSSTLQLTATLKPAGASSNIVWTSSASGIATVSGGMVRPVSPGTATITATTARGNLKDSVKVRVTDRTIPTGISMDFASPQYLDLNETLPLRYTLYPAGARSNVQWGSNAPGIAKVRDGQVIPGVRGTATITGTTGRGGKKCSFKVIVVDKHAPISITIHRDSKKNIHVGRIRTMGYTVEGWKGYETRVNLHWKTSNSKVIKVTNATRGVFEALSPGKARITVTTDNGKKASFTIHVVK